MLKTLLGFPCHSGYSLCYTPCSRVCFSGLLCVCPLLLVHWAPVPLPCPVRAWTWLVTPASGPLNLLARLPGVLLAAALRLHPSSEVTFLETPLQALASVLTYSVAQKSLSSSLLYFIFYFFDSPSYTLGLFYLVSFSNYLPISVPVCVCVCVCLYRPIRLRGPETTVIVSEQHLQHLG